MKKILAIVLCIMALLGTMATAHAESGSCGPNATYTLDDSSGLLTISGTGGISANAFRSRTDITTVIIESGIITIGNSAFSGCTSLETVSIKGDIAVIGGSAFSGCVSLTTLNYESSIEPTVSRSAFSRTALSVVYVPADYAGSDFCGFEIQRINSSVPVEAVTLYYMNGDTAMLPPDSGLELASAGASLQLKAEVSPANADNKNVRWSSASAGDYPNFAGIDAGGKVTADFSAFSDADFGKADSQYDALVTVTSEDGGKTDSCRIWVKKHTLVFEDADGSELARIGRPVGAAITAPAEPVKSGLRFMGWKDASGSMADGLPATMPAGDQVYTAVWKQISFPVNIAGSENGSVFADKTAAEAGETITLNATPVLGYRLGSITIEDAEGNPVQMDGMSFIMPEGGATIRASFVPEAAAVVPEIPDTGDGFNMVLWAGLMVLSAGMMLALKKRYN